MSKTHFKFWLIFVLVITSQSSFALSLGDIKVNSTFAQPFLAEIKLPSYTEDEMESIQVHLASKKQYAQQGIDLVPVLRKFHFSVEEKKDGTLYIKIHTKLPVKELSISFLIEVTWKGGRIIKSYDVLLTPEAITEFWDKRAKEQIAKLDVETSSEAEPGASAQIRQKATKIKKPNKTTIRQPTRTASASKSQKGNGKKPKNSKLRKTKNGGIEYSPVGRGDSLSLIAQRIRPNKDMSLNQVMVALFNENRKAFMNDDINRLLSGVTLKIADTSVITSISKKEARELAHLYMTGAKPKTKSTMFAQNKATKPATEAQAPDNIVQEGNRLEISSANEEPIPPEILQQLKSEQIASAEEELKIAQLDANKLKNENNELKERISKLEEQLDSTAENLFLATIAQEIVKDAPEVTSLTQQDQNLIVTNTDLAMAGEEKLSLLQRIEKYQTAISISSATLLSMTLIGFRKKEQILNLVHNLKDKLNKSKNDDIQFS